MTIYFSALNDPAVLQYDDLICRAHGGQTVGNHQDRFAFCQLPDGLLQLLLVFGIHAGCGFIQNDDGCVLQNCPCNGDSLLFSAGEAGAAFADLCLITVGQCHDTAISETAYIRQGAINTVRIYDNASENVC